MINLANRKEVFKIIGDSIPKEQTDAIYVFGSYLTKFFGDNSDIDVAWFPNTLITEIDRIDLELLLKDKLGVDVDLILPSKDKFYSLLGNVLSGEPVGYMSYEFSEWFDLNVCRIMDEYNFLQERM